MYVIYLFGGFSKLYKMTNCGYFFIFTKIIKHHQINEKLLRVVNLEYYLVFQLQLLKKQLVSTHFKTSTEKPPQVPPQFDFFPHLALNSFQDKLNL